MITLTVNIRVKSKLLLATKISASLLRAFYAVLFFSSTSSIADVLEPLNFGVIVIAKNDRVSTVKLPTNYAMSSSNDIHIIEKGHPAKLYFDNLPVHTLINISSSSHNVKLEQGSVSTAFTITQLLFKPTEHSNGYGEIELLLGAILQTSGTGESYTDGSYQGRVSIELSY